MSEIRHKKGTTFSYSGLVKLPAGSWAAACKLNAADGALVETLSVTLTALGSLGPAGETHSILLESSATGTSDWPIARLQGDIAFTSGAIVIATNTFFVIVQKGETNA